MQPSEPTSAGVWRVPAPKSRYSLEDAEAVDEICNALNSVIETIVVSNNLFAGAASKHAFMTFATPEYHWGLVGWLRSLRKVSDKPAFVLVSREMPAPEDIPGVYLIVMPTLYVEQQEKEAKFRRPELRHSMNKLWIFAATALDRVFYADADCLFLKSADELFDRSGFLVCPDYVEARVVDDFNAGVMIFDPDIELRKRIFSQVPVAPFGDGGDQIALNEILREEVVFIDEKYNLLRHFHDASFEPSRNDARLIHYIVKKPWDFHLQESPDLALARLDDLWTSFLSPAELLELVAQWRRVAFRNSEYQRIAAWKTEVQSESKAQASRDFNARLLNDLIRKVRRAKRSVLMGIVGLAAAVIILTFVLLLRR